jgi:hypothetical protein
MALILRDAFLIVDGWDGIEHSPEQVIEAWQHIIDCGTVPQVTDEDRRRIADMIARGLCRPRAA